MLDQGKKIEAIKIYREATNAGLKEAKDAVKAIERGTPLQEVGTELEADLVDLCRQGQKIGAIKLLRERTGCRLKEAKDSVEALAARHGIAMKGTGCVPALALVVIGLMTWAVGLI
jgi:ribosomal protein L7/L12